jgi:hypothetical protein
MEASSSLKEAIFVPVIVRRFPSTTEGATNLYRIALSLGRYQTK